MIYFLLVTAIAVSIDSFICGFSLSAFTHKKTKVFLSVCSVVFFMCLLSNYLAVFLSMLKNIPVGELGGLILIFVGLFNILKPKKEINSNDNFNVLMVSFAVGLDGAMANLSLALMGINYFYVPVIIAIFHAIAVFFGIVLSKLEFIKKINTYAYIPYLILILLGFYKFLGVFL